MLSESLWVVGELHDGAHALVSVDGEFEAERLPGLRVANDCFIERIACSAKHLHHDDAKALAVPDDLPPGPAVGSLGRDGSQLRKPGHTSLGSAT